MASSYSSNLKLEKQGTNENTGTWGANLNTNVIDLVDEAVGGVASIAITGNTTLTIGDGTTANTRHMVLVFTGTLSANAAITVPAIEKLWIIFNNTTGGYSLVIAPSGGTTVVVPATEAVPVYSDGTNCYRGNTALIDKDGDTMFEVERSTDDDTARIKAGGVTVAQITPTAFVVNEAGSATVDFRVESDNFANLFHIDASEEAINIGVAPPATQSFMNFCGTTSDATSSAEMSFYSGANSASNLMEIRSEVTLTVTSTPERIARLDTLGGLIVVVGDDGAGNKFTDTVVAFGSGGTPATLGSGVVGSPATRTYSISTTDLRVAMGSGSYTVRTFLIGGRVS